MSNISASKVRKVTDRERKRRERESKKRMAAAAKAAAAEEKAEFGAPKIQREPVLGRNGEVIRGSRLEPDGISFKRSNPVKRLVALQRNKPDPTFVKKHELAADRLMIAWEEGAGGISAGCSNYGERAGGSATTGMIAEHVLAVLNQQMKARQEVEGAMAFLGSLWPPVHAVVIRGIDVGAWAESTGMDSKVATGYLLGALSRLVEFFQPEPEQRSRIRSIEIAGLTLDEPGMSK